MHSTLNRNTKIHCRNQIQFGDYSPPLHTERFVRARRHLPTTPLGPLMDKPLSVTNGCPAKPTLRAAGWRGCCDGRSLRRAQPCGHSAFRTSSGPLPEAPLSDAWEWAGNQAGPRGTQLEGMSQWSSTLHKGPGVSEFLNL